MVVVDASSHICISSTTRLNSLVALFAFALASRGRAVNGIRPVDILEQGVVECLAGVIVNEAVPGSLEALHLVPHLL